MAEPLVVVDPEDDAPPWAQIFEQLRGFVESGALPAGAPLPTVRQLAADLELAPNTVARAYAALQDEGWVEADGRRGTRVAGRVPGAARERRERALHEAVAKAIGTLLRRGYAPAEIEAAFSRAARGASGTRTPR